MSTFIIAEAGVNHNGSIDLAYKLIDIAYESGANAIKFQTFTAENLVLKHTQKADYQKQSRSLNESQFDMIKKLELGVEDHKKLKCKKFIIFEKKNSLNEIFIVASKKRKKFFFHTIELNYCSDIESLKKIWPQVSLEIAKKYKVCFCSQYFLKENHCVIPKELKLLNDSKYEVVVKDLPESLMFDTLYSELVY